MKQLFGILITLIFIINNAENIVLNLKINENNLISSRKRRAALEHNTGKFKKFPIKYKINTNVNVSLVERAIKSFEKESCLRFQRVETLNETGLDFIFSKKLFYAESLGAISEIIPLKIGVPKKPARLGFLIHEMLHALGLLHEHQRVDRDEYVTINFDNVDEKYHGNFIKDYIFGNETYGIKYDYGSILHYEREAGHIKGKKNKTTIKAKNPHYHKSMGQGIYFSFLDTKLLNKRYCKDKCKNEEKITCYHGGYPNPNNCKICKCPTFYEPPFCKYVKASPEKCGKKINLASKNYQTLKMRGIINCYYILRAEENQRVRIIIKKAKSLSTPICRPGSGLNIKFLKNKALSPACFCSYIQNYQITSQGREVIIRYAGRSARDFFVLQYKSI
ncbi:Astacin-like metalloendopeptidase [Strongyloides ratti]|uniref:Metalloendopeptidase n=1 Tax=Strongyloides ratti TaxID=34506 RepID=A0A090LJK3_STRRB|nr:Astacin-like metalloendopeptidase [Strongyloides ratti]CEF69893.1 Astacin-like metalloendopeptidase [Strongyloides ratti]